MNSAQNSNRSYYVEIMTYISTILGLDALQDFVIWKSAIVKCFLTLVTM